MQVSLYNNLAVVTSKQAPTGMCLQGQVRELNGLLAASRTQAGPERMASSKSLMELSLAAWQTVAVLDKTLAVEEQRWRADH